MEDTNITRRQMLKQSAVLAVGAGLGLTFSGQAKSSPGSAKLPFEEYIRYDAIGLAELVARGEISPLELLEAAIQRTEVVNPKIDLNALPYDGCGRDGLSFLALGPVALTCYKYKGWEI